jgi:hypothetical protein
MTLHQTTGPMPMTERTAVRRVTVIAMAKEAQWAVAVRLADGSHLYLCAAGTRRGGQGNWSTRVNQALRFAAKAEADNVVAGFELNAAAKEYVVVRL